MDRYFALPIVLDSAIRFKVEKPKHNTLLAALKPDLEFDNPDYINALRYGRKPYRISEKIRCYDWDRTTRTLSLPRGYWRRFQEHARRLGYVLQVDDRRVEHPKVSVPSRIELRDYQEPAVEELLVATQGVLVAPPGAGKTEMTLEVLARIGEPVLWITHKQDLLVQVRDRAVSRLGLSSKEIGIIGRGEERIGKWLTIGLVQTLRRRDLSRWADLWGVVVIDECHHVPAYTFREVVHQLPAKRRYGLTGTPNRADGLHPMMELYIGPIVHRIEPEVVREAGGTITPRHKTISTGVRSEVWDRYEQEVREWEMLCEQLALEGMGDQAPPKPRLPWNELIEDLLTNVERNARIVHVLAQWAPGHSNLVLTGRVSHAMELRERLAEVNPALKSEIIHHGMGLTRRHEAVDAMRRGELDILFAVDIPKEGLDIPRLDRIYFTAGGKDPIMIKQSVGRIQRPHPEKDDALVVDFVDFDIPIMRIHFFQRCKLYRELGMDVGGSKPLKQTA